jgi:RNA polymerase sigma-70 factor (ECF subfamily)
MTREDDFPDTSWTLIRQTGTDEKSLEEWCRSYWRPVRDYIRAMGHNDDSANELTQSFFLKLFSKEREKMLPGQLSGAFRAYLKRAVRNHLIDTWRSSQSKRRGGNATHFEIREDDATGHLPADLAFERAWVVTILHRASDSLQKELEGAGKGHLFEAFATYLDGKEPGEKQSDLARELNMSDGAFRVALHRLRERFRQKIEEELRQTVATQGELEEEIRNLLTVWS